MIIRLFRDNQILSVLFSSLLSVALWIISGFHKIYEPPAISVLNSGLFYVAPGLKQMDSAQVLFSAVNVIVLLLSSFYFSRIIVRHQIIPQRTSLPSLIFVLISSPFFISYNGLSYPLLTLFVLLVILNMLFQTIDSKVTSMRFFDSALILSFASIINFYCLFLALFLIFIWLQYRGLARWRELVFIIVGITLPYLFFFAGLYIADITISGFLNSLFVFKGNKISLPGFPSLYVLGIFTGILILIASKHILQKYVNMKIVSRKFSLIFLSLFFVTLLIAMLYPGVESDIIFFLALPVGFLLSYYFSTCRINLFNQILFVLLIVTNLVVVFWK